MIRITKTIVGVDNATFYDTLKQLCFDFKKHNRSLIGLKYSKIKSELGLKLTPLQFFKICEECGIEIRRDILFFDQFKTEKNTT